jgi:hypothetical protein
LANEPGLLQRLGLVRIEVVKGLLENFGKTENEQKEHPVNGAE